MHSSLTQLVQLGLRMSVRPECPKIFESLASNGPKLTSSSTNKLCSDVQFILIKDYLSGLFEIQSKDYFRRNYFSKSSANGFNWLWLFSFKFLLNVELFSSLQSKKFRCFQWDFSLFYWILTGLGGHDVSFEIFIFAEVLNLQKTEIILSWLLTLWCGHINGLPEYENSWAIKSFFKNGLFFVYFRSFSNNFTTN